MVHKRKVSAFVGCLCLSLLTLWIYLLFRTTIFYEDYPTSNVEAMRRGSHPLSRSSGQLIRETRVIGIGDIHGDVFALRRALELASLVDQRGNWIGADSAAVQVGDLIDQAAKADLQTLSYVKSLAKQAQAAGGLFKVVLGDHDVNNLPLLWRGQNLPWWMDLAVVHGSSLFVHGSLNLEWFNKMPGGLHEINDAARTFLSPIGANIAVPPKWLHDQNGLMWSRTFASEDVSQIQCRQLGTLLADLGLKRMIIGHTARPEGISQVCGGLCWRIDVGLGKSQGRAGNVNASQVLGCCLSFLRFPPQAMCGCRCWRLSSCIIAMWEVSKAKSGSLSGHAFQLSAQMNKKWVLG